MIFPESLQSTRWSVCSAESSLVSVVALPSLVMIQQNTPSNSLISVIQEISHSFIGGISNNINIKLVVYVYHRCFKGRAEWKVSGEGSLFEATEPEGCDCDKVTIEKVNESFPEEDKEIELV